MPSSVVASMHFDPLKNTLRVIYTSGSVYDYKAVPEKIYSAMKNSTSKGNYLNKYIKGKYDFEKVEDQDLAI